MPDHQDPSRQASNEAELGRSIRYRSHTEELAAADIGLTGHIGSSWQLFDAFIRLLKVF